MGVKALKGSVVIKTRGDRIQLVWRYAGKRHYLSLALPASPASMKAAKRLALQIELDVAAGHFDESLDRYRMPHQRPTLRKKPEDLLDKFLASRSLTRATEFGYVAAWNWLQKWGKKVKTGGDAGEFISWLAPKLAPETLRSYLIRLAAIWQWGVEERIFDYNPWTRIKVKVPNPEPRPFTKDEAELIIRGAPGVYREYIEFLFLTGARTGEAASLRWDDVAADCSSVVLRGKTGSRKIFLSDRARSILLRIERSDGLVFLTPTGRKIQRNNFRNRVWVPLLESLGVDYRKPYCARSTFVTAALESGVSPVDLARVTGHSTQTMFRNYLGGAAGKLPDVF